MLHVTLLCSEPDCAELIEIDVESLDELDGLSCECRYGLVLLRVEELQPA